VTRNNKFFLPRREGSVLSRDQDQSIVKMPKISKHKIKQAKNSGFPRITYRAEATQCDLIPTVTAVAVEPLEGTIEPMNGTIEPMNGTIEPMDGTIEPMDGTIEPMDVTIEPMDMTIETFDETLRLSDKTGEVATERVKIGTFKNTSGRRILSFQSLQEGITDVCAHSKTCRVASMQLDLERRNGLKTELVYKCKCGWVVVFSTDTDKNSLPINDSFAWGCEIAPVGFSSASCLLTTMDIPVPDYRTFKTHETKCKNDMEEGFLKEMQENLSRERQLAIDDGEYVNVEGISYASITVCVDCGWSKRCYGHSYNANCGVAVIIGVRTKKIIYADTRCSTCLVCDKVPSDGSEENVDCTPHICCKNWSGPATAMESDIIKAGFLQSRQHGLVYSSFIGDGDSSVHASVENIYPGMKVNKVECKNHLFKNLTKKLMALAFNKVTGKNSVSISIQERRELNKHLHRIPIAIKMAVKHYSEIKSSTIWMQLQRDILNIPYHIFGRHTSCKAYFCKPDDENKTNETDRISQMMNSSFWSPLLAAITKIANESKSLMENTTSNLSESFMSVANKFIEGKRKNFGQGGLYRHRILAAVFSYNHCDFWSSVVYETVFDKQPSTPWRNKYASSRRQRQRKRKPKAARKIKFPVHEDGKGDRHYGSDPSKPDIPANVLVIAVASLKSSLQVDDFAQTEIEEATRDQSDSDRWIEERLKRITASNAHLISNLRPKTDNTAALNKHFGRRVYKKLIPLMEYGKKHETEAVKAYELVRNIPHGSVRKCGLFVSKENGIFAASPDGIISDGILEVKCPPSIKDMDPKEWPLLKPKTSWLHYIGGELILKRSNQYYSQIVMQLHVTNRTWCDFFIWTPKGHFIERIFKNVATEKQWVKMKKNMEYFWENDLAPELVDSRFARGYNTYRHPPSRQGAVNHKLIKINSKKAIGT